MARSSMPRVVSIELKLPEIQLLVAELEHAIGHLGLDQARGRAVDALLTEIRTQLKDGPRQRRIGL